MLALAGHQVPLTLLRYPKLVRDGEYCYEKLQPILGAVQLTEFLQAFKATAHLDLVHQFCAGDA
jgi:hypothetical protein